MGFALFSETIDPRSHPQKMKDRRGSYRACRPSSISSHVSFWNRDGDFVAGALDFHFARLHGLGQSHHLLVLTELSETRAAATGISIILLRCSAIQIREVVASISRQVASKFQQLKSNRNDVRQPEDAIPQLPNSCARVVGLFRVPHAQSKEDQVCHQEEKQHELDSSSCRDRDANKSNQCVYQKS